MGIWLSRLIISKKSKAFFGLKKMFSSKNLFRNRTMSTPDESDESESQDRVRRPQPAQSDDRKNEDEMIKSTPLMNTSNQSPKVLRRQTNLMNRTSIDLENEENSAWHNLPKDVWKKAAEVNDK